MKIKTSELIDDALDWAVASLHGYTLTSDGISKLLQRGKEMRMLCSGSASLSYSPSTDWSQGGPIIEREWLDVTPWPNESDEGLRWQCKQHDSIDCVAFGPTPLIAAMRCFCYARLGAEVDIPEELLR